MTLEGTVKNGTLVPDTGGRLPEGARVRFELVEGNIELPDEKLPDDHPDAPYDRVKELAILRESIAEMKAGGGRPWREVMEELSLKHGLDPLPAE